MRIFNTVEQLRTHLDSGVKGVIGFVPTMGALHEGHLSLVEQSCKDCDTTVVSIFVNPTQFNDPDDLKKYPRDIESDTALIAALFSDNDILFVPDYEDLYSYEEDYAVDLEGLDKVMEGEHRPGHFEGVVRVVKLLFESVRPAKAYFGQKDFQQLSIIRKMVDKLDMDIAIIGCPILREEHGLAMSSRNERLAPVIREKAAIIYSTLSKYNSIKSFSDLPLLKNKIIREIESSGDFRVEYLEIVDNVSLSAPSVSSDLIPEVKYFACIAVFAGEVRLIDNIEFSFQFIKG